MKCKDCKYFDNTKPVTTERNSEYKHAEEYIGRCSEVDTIKMMNDSCCLFKSKEESNEHN